MTLYRTLHWSPTDNQLMHGAVANSPAPTPGTMRFRSDTLGLQSIFLCDQFDPDFTTREASREDEIGKRVGC